MERKESRISFPFLETFGHPYPYTKTQLEACCSIYLEVLDLQYLYDEIARHRPPLLRNADGIRSTRLHCQNPSLTPYCAPN